MFKFKTMSQLLLCSALTLLISACVGPKTNSESELASSVLFVTLPWNNTYRVWTDGTYQVDFSGNYFVNGRHHARMTCSGSTSFSCSSSNPSLSFTANCAAGLGVTPCANGRLQINISTPTFPPSGGGSSGTATIDIDAVRGRMVARYTDHVNSGFPGFVSCRGMRTEIRSVYLARNGGRLPDPVAANEQVFCTAIREMERAGYCRRWTNPHDNATGVCGDPQL